MKLDGKIEPITLLLLFTMMFYTVALFVAEFRFQSDAVFFQVISNILSGIVGAFLMRTKPAGSPSPPENASTVQATTTVQETKTTIPASDIKAPE